MYRNYSTLGNSCIPQTIAHTSNNKILLPCSGAYNSICSNMRYYPVSSNTYIEDGLSNFPNENPELVKSYYLVNDPIYGQWNRDTMNGTVFRTQYLKPGNCTTCSSR